MSIFIIPTSCYAASSVVLAVLEYVIINICCLPAAAAAAVLLCSIMYVVCGVVYAKIVKQIVKQR